MPDDHGSLTQQDRDTIQRWWTGRWKNPVICPVCKTTEWWLAEHVVNFNRHAPDRWEPESVSYPHIMVGCKTCFHTMFFNAVAVGVSPPHPDEAAELALLPPPPAGE
jgi:hypothetical protein